MITIREADLNDSEVLALLGRVTFDESHGPYIENKSDLLHHLNSNFSIKKIEKNLEDSNNVYLIIYADKLPVGYAKLILNLEEKNVKSNKVCSLDKIYVLNDFISMKIGYQLFVAIVEKAKALNFEHMWLYTYYKNEKAVKFYLRNDFVEAGRHIFYVNETGYENIVFLKEL